MSAEDRRNRRDLFTRFSKAGLALSLAACDKGSSQEKNPLQLTPEVGVKPRVFRDVFYGEGKYYIVRNEKVYELTPAQFETYKSLTRFDAYKRSVVYTGKPSDVIEAPVPQKDALVDEFTGWIKHNKEKGGEVLDFWGGFLSDDRNTYDPMSVNKRLYVGMRREIEKSGWTDRDYFFFTYGGKGFEVYSPKETARDPEENITKGIEFIEKQIDEQPLVQRTGVYHSLGGVIGIRAVMKHPEAFNNIVLLSSPVYGIEETWDRSIIAGIVHQGLRPILGEEEKITRYLFDLWKNKKWREEIDDFIEWFTAQGKGVYCYVVENDRITPKESAILKGALKQLHGRELSQILPKVNSLNPLDPHGVPLSDAEVIRDVKEIMAENSLKPA